MGEKGMESPAPVRTGVTGAAELMAPIAGVGDMAAGGSGASLGGNMAGGALGGVSGGTGGGLGEALSRSNEQAGDAIRQPPKG
jgi:hypothetical protein